MLSTQEGYSLEILDTFASEWITSKSWEKLPKNFFAQRVQAEGAHLKAFAAEVLLVIPILYMFGMTVLQPAGVLPEHARCMGLMARILAILQAGDDAVRHVHELTALIGEHARAFALLYEDLAKPKFHWMFHIPRGLRRFGNYSCFGPERKHRIVKTIAAQVMGTHLDQNLCLRACAEMLRCMQDASLTATSLLPPVTDIPWAVDILSDMAGDTHVQKVERSQTMRTKRALLASDDVVFCEAAAVVLQIKCYLRAWCRNGACLYFAHASMHERKRSNIFARGGTLALVAWSDDFASLLFQRVFLFLSYNGYPYIKV